MLSRQQFPQDPRENPLAAKLQAANEVIDGIFVLIKKQSSY